MEISFSVRGLPAPQGSKTARPVYRKGPGGKAIPTGKINQVESSKRLRPWRDLVHAAAEDARDRWLRSYTTPADTAAWGRMFDGPVTATLTFVFTRTSGHYGTGRNAGIVKASAPAFPTTNRSGDLDKLVRGVLDAMTRVIYRDDSQVVSIYAHKRYGGQSGLVAVVRPTEAVVGELWVGGAP